MSSLYVFTKKKRKKDWAVSNHLLGSPAPWLCCELLNRISVFGCVDHLINIWFDPITFDLIWSNYIWICIDLINITLLKWYLTCVSVKPPDTHLIWFDSNLFGLVWLESDSIYFTCMPFIIAGNNTHVRAGETCPNWHVWALFSIRRKMRPKDKHYIHILLQYATHIMCIFNFLFYCVSK